MTTTTTTTGQWTLSLPNGDEPPKAIVVIIGWWGSQPKHLKKYASNIYTKDWNCATLAGTAPPRDILFKNDTALQIFAQDCLQALSDFLQDSEINTNPRIPVFIHLFSNGGGFVWEHMEQLLHNSASDRLFESFSSFDSEDTPLHCNTNFYAIRRNLAGIIYDSCPCYPSWRSGKNALSASLTASGSPIIVVWFLTAIMYVGYLLEHLWNCIRGKKQHRLKEWFQHLQDSDLCHQEAYVYSTADNVCEPTHLQDFISSRKQRHHAIVEVLEFDDSPHVQHYLKHPDEYADFIHTFCSRCLQIHANVVNGIADPSTATKQASLV